MFDIGFFELLLIGVVTLLVVGPERLPKVARTAGLWVRKARTFVSGVKAEIDQEVRAEELKQILEKQAASNPLEEIIEDPLDVKSSVEEALDLKPSDKKPEDKS